MRTPLAMRVAQSNKEFQRAKHDVPCYIPDDNEIQRGLLHSYADSFREPLIN